MTTEFNAIDYATELESAGVPKEQAAIHAGALTKVLNGYALSRELEAMRIELRAQLSQLRSEFEAFKVEISARITCLEISLRAEIARVETSLRAEIARVESSLKVEINIVKSGIGQLRWLVGISATLQIAVLAKLIFP